MPTTPEMISTKENRSTQNASSSSFRMGNLSKIQIWVHLCLALQPFRTSSLPARKNPGQSFSVFTRQFFIIEYFNSLAHMSLFCFWLLAPATLNNFLSIPCVLLPLSLYEASFSTWGAPSPKLSPISLNLTPTQLSDPALVLLPQESLPWVYKSESGTAATRSRNTYISHIASITLLSNGLPICQFPPKSLSSKKTGIASVLFAVISIALSSHLSYTYL